MINIKLSDLYDNMRLDKYLKKNYALLTQGVLQAMLRKSIIKVNGKKVETSTRVFTGDVVTIYNDMSQYVGHHESVDYSNNIKVLAKKILDSYAVYEDESMLIINKPSNLATQGGIGINISVDHALKYINQANNVDFKLVHRLDKETSGILVIAKNYLAAKKIGELFREDEVNKTYIAVLEGIPRKLSGVVRNFVSKTKNKNDQFIIDEDERNGKISITKYKILSINEKHNISLCVFFPMTGRMHQLRHHANMIGCNILGDTKYRIYKAPKIEAQHLMLHAYSIYMSLVRDSILADIPKHMLNMINKHFHVDSSSRVDLDM